MRNWIFLLKLFYKIIRWLYRRRKMRYAKISKPFAK
nr:MAG TPA: hypothetical protein [Caudoviricetes sp.]